MGDFTKAIQDPDFWKGMREAFRSAPQRAWDTLSEYGKIPARADRIAEERFPDSARDSSRKNAFRHALGTGMLTQELGGNPVSAAAAKAAGWGWEAWGALNRENTEETWDDTLHDLNANAVGAQTAQEARTQQELVDRLERLARESIEDPALQHWRPGNTRMTRSVR